MARVLTGIQSTNIPHLGNILGAMLPAIKMSNEKENEALLFIADLHSLTTVKDPVFLRNSAYAVAAAWIALGFDTEKNILFRQSDVTEVCELTWYLSCFTPFPMLANAHGFKDKSETLGDVTAGLFTYPVLMAADILLYDTNFVPVGKDQLQHLEMTRDIARSFNHRMGETLVIPDAKINEETMLVPGTDGRKMSKSYNNFINIFLPEKELKKQIAGIVTDAKPLEEPKDPETCNVFAIYKIVANEEQVIKMKASYLAGNYGYGHAKAALTEVILERFSVARKKYTELMSDFSLLDKELKKGEDKARKIALPVLSRVREKTGFKP
ncbi:MAG: tryptophan--tRNA ligase [Bacteroidia bacterium]|nr:tryptophan--tRNA ligase [Bacteroidia bacterium]